MKITREGCDNCGSVPDGDRIDNILWLDCTHAICSRCRDREVRKFNNEKMCPICRLEMINTERPRI